MRLACWFAAADERAALDTARSPSVSSSHIPALAFRHCVCAHNRAFHTSREPERRESEVRPRQQEISRKGAGVLKEPSPSAAEPMSGRNQAARHGDCDYFTRLCRNALPSEPGKPQSCIRRPVEETRTSKSCKWVAEAIVNGRA